MFFYRVIKGKVMAAINHDNFIEAFSEETNDMHKAITLLMESIEGMDSYKQRIETCEDVALKAILINHRNQKKTQIEAVLKWINQVDPLFVEELKRCLLNHKQQ